VLIWKLFQYVGVLEKYSDEVTAMTKCFDGIAIGTRYYILLKCTKTIEMSANNIRQDWEKIVLRIHISIRPENPEDEKKMQILETCMMSAVSIFSIGGITSRSIANVHPH
jgi:hypothetical protein